MLVHNILRQHTMPPPTRAQIERRCICAKTLVIRSDLLFLSRPVSKNPWKRRNRIYLNREIFFSQSAYPLLTAKLIFPPTPVFWNQPILVRPKYSLLRGNLQ